MTKFRSAIVAACFAAFSVLLQCVALAENWVPTGAADGTEFDKDRFFKTKTPDIFWVWMREHVRKRIGEQRIIQVIYNLEIDCYERKYRTLEAWQMLDNKRLQKMSLEGTYTGTFAFNEYAKFFDSVICKQSNEFYKKR